RQVPRGVWILDEVVELHDPPAGLLPNDRLVRPRRDDGDFAGGRLAAFRHLETVGQRLSAPRESEQGNQSDLVHDTILPGVVEGDTGLGVPASTISVFRGVVPTERGGQRCEARSRCHSITAPRSCLETLTKIGVRCRNPGKTGSSEPAGWHFRPRPPVSSGKIEAISRNVAG